MMTPDDCALLKQMVTDSIQHRLRLAESLAVYGASVRQAFEPDLNLLKTLDQLERGVLVIVTAEELTLLRRTAVTGVSPANEVVTHVDKKFVPATPRRVGERPRQPSGGYGYSKYDHPYGTKDVRDKGHGVIRKFKRPKGGYRWYLDTGSRSDRKVTFPNVAEARANWPKAIAPGLGGRAAHKKYKEEQAAKAETPTTEE